MGEVLVTCYATAVPLVAVRWSAEHDVSSLAGGEVHHRCLRCGATDHGQPLLADGRHISIARAGGLTVVAIATRPVGVDVEPSTPDAQDWVRREALLKLRGLGLALDPSTIAIRDGRVDGWRRARVVDVGAVPGHAVAAAIEAWRRPTVMAAPGAPPGAARGAARQRTARRRAR